MVGLESLGLVVGHLLGDYIFQNDWMAKWKTGVVPRDVAEAQAGAASLVYGDTRMAYLSAFDTRNAMETFSACTLHCLLYTLAVWLCSFWWMPVWGLGVCFTTHWLIDRFRLARWWMLNVSGQKEFATGALSPWSVIVVDNTFHLVTLFCIAVVWQLFGG